MAVVVCVQLSYGVLESWLLPVLMSPFYSGHRRSRIQKRSPARRPTRFLKDTCLFQYTSEAFRLEYVTGI